MPEIKATSRTSIGIKLTGEGGKLNYYEGKIKGTKTEIKAVEGATAYIIPTGYMDKIETIEENGIIYRVSYLSNEAAVTLTMDGKTTSYLSLLDALEKVPSDGREAIITMQTDETLKEIAKIYNGQNITIDLNGHTITRTEDIDRYLYTFINNGTLVLKDSTETKQGKVQAIATKDVTTYAVYNMEDGDLTIDGVTLFASINTSSNSKNYYGLYNIATVKVKFYEGKIYGENAKSVQTYLNLEKVETLENKYMHQGLEKIDEITYKTNYISDTPVVTLTINGETTGYSTIHDAINNIQDNTEATIKMEADEELFRYIDIPRDRNIILDLNGKTITVNKLKNGWRILYKSK